MAAPSLTVQPSPDAFYVGITTTEWERTGPFPDTVEVQIHVTPGRIELNTRDNMHSITLHLSVGSRTDVAEMELVGEVFLDGPIVLDQGPMGYLRPDFAVPAATYQVYGRHSDPADPEHLTFWVHLVPRD